MIHAALKSKHALYLVVLGCFLFSEISHAEAQATFTPSAEPLCEGFLEESIPTEECVSYNIYHLQVPAQEGETRKSIEALVKKHGFRVNKCEKTWMPFLRFRKKSLAKVTVFFKSPTPYSEERREFNRLLQRISSDPDVVLLTHHETITNPCPK